jgi:hypothetical protein
LFLTEARAAPAAHEAGKFRPKGAKFTSANGFLEIDLAKEAALFRDENCLIPDSVWRRDGFHEQARAIEQWLSPKNRQIHDQKISIGSAEAWFSRHGGAKCFCSGAMRSALGAVFRGDSIKVCRLN